MKSIIARMTEASFRAERKHENPMKTTITPKAAAVRPLKPQLENETGNTPGPWTIHDNIGRKSELGIIADAAPCIIATIHGYKINEWPTIAKANARLIAAAPELLEALERTLFSLSMYMQDAGRDIENDKQLCEARTAIAKARGEKEAS